jgi:hypothetical protein
VLSNEPASAPSAPSRRRLAITESHPILAILGGTGALGTGLGRRWANAGLDVIIGSRAREKAAAAVQSLKGRVPEGRLRAMENADAARAADVAVLTVPFAHHDSTLAGLADALQGKILVDATVPLVPPKVSRVQLPPEGSAAKAAQALLGDGVTVVSAFQNVAADKLAKEDGPLDCDVLVSGDKREARETVIGLAAAAGLKGWHAGPLDNSVAAEALTSVLIFMNRHYRLDGAGLRITGAPAPPEASDR